MTDPTVQVAHWSDAVARLGACKDAVTWLRTQPDAATAWARCERGDWMLWIAGRTDIPRRVLVQAAVECAALDLPQWESKFPDDALVRACIEVTRRWCDGQATGDEVRQARAAAYYAAYAAADARTAGLAECADIVRTYIPEVPHV